MAEDRFQVAIVLERRTLEGTWGGEQWLARAVLPDVPAAACGTLLAREGGRELCYGGSAEVVLHASDAGHYRDNLASLRPSLWVALETGGGEPCRIASVTADPYEGEALAGAMDLVVEPVAMPAEIVERVAAFVAVHYVERAFIKRQRDAPDAEAATPRRRGASSSGESG